MYRPHTLGFDVAVCHRRRTGPVRLLAPPWEARPRPPAPPPAQVTVAEVIHQPLRDWSEFTGRLEAIQSVEVRPRVSGYIDRIEFLEGTRVKKGQILFRIDPRPFRAETERQFAARTRAISQLELAKANHARAPAAHRGERHCARRIRTSVER